MKAFITVLSLFIVSFMYGQAFAQSRLKDVVSVQGVRDNQLVGYGLVVGLNGTGDDLGSAVFTQESIIGMLERLGVNARVDGLNTENIAAVIITANLPAFGQAGERIDVSVSAIGNASSLLGGTLLATPLLGADGEVYAVAQGTTVVQGYNAGGQSDEFTKNVPTNARLPNGAIIEKEIPFDFRKLKEFRLAIRSPDFTTARRVAGAVNALLGVQTASVVSPGVVNVEVPSDYAGGAIGLATDIEQLRIETDSNAQVIIDERSGLIVMGRNVRIDELAIAQGNLSVEIDNFANNRQDNILPVDETIFGQNADALNENQENAGEDTEAKNFGILKPGLVLNDLVRGFNSLGISPRDMINILQAIKAAGALQADIKIL